MVKAVALAGKDWGIRAAWLDGLDVLSMFDLEQGINARYVFFLNWSQRVPESIWGRYECINFHCTPLPFGRGGGPIEGMILSGHTDTVITAHHMTSEMDAGPIYCVSEPVSLSGTKDDICARFVKPVAKMMRFIINTNPEPITQVGEPVYFTRLSPEAYEAFWRARG